MAPAAITNTITTILPRRHRVMDVVIWGQAHWEVWLRAAGRFGRPTRGGCGRE